MSSHKKKRQSKISAVPGPHRSRTLWIVASLLALGVSGLLLVKRNHPSVSPSTASRSSPASLTIVPDEQQVFAGYAGSTSCQACHEEAYNAWKTSNHGLAERRPLAALDEAAFQPARTIQHASQHTDVSFTNGQYRVVTLGPSNRYEAFTMERVIGHDPLRQFLVKFPGGRHQTLEASYDPHRNEWFNVYGNEDRQPGEWGHWTGRGMNWNHMCASCHNTRVRKNYNEASDTYHTTMAELTVGCEACHGPLKAHNDWQKQHGKSGQKDPTVSKLKLPHTRMMDNCGLCHARRGELTGDFKPGDDFSDHLRLTMVDATDVYYPDGQVREEDYEYASFLSSRMHLRGVNCLDCHNPHSSKTILPGNLLCMRCHNGSVTNAPVINPVAHSRHKVFGYDASGALTNLDLASYKPKEIKETGGECVNCHMPQTAYMQRHWRHDHGFTIPDPLLTKQHGVPNACNRCHQDKDTNWALKYCDEWYGEKMERPTRQRAQIIAAARKGENTSRDGLLRLFATEEIPYWRAVAAGLLAPWSGETPVGDVLIRGLADTNALVRAECIRALEPLIDANVPPVVESIRQRLDDHVRSVRIAAAWALRATVDPASKAGSELLHSLDINADQPAGQMQKGAFAVARKQPEKALAHYQKAAEWDPNSAVVRHDLAVLLVSLNRNAEATAQLGAACRLEPRNAEYRYKLALAWNETGQTTKTIEALQAAVQLDSQHARAWYNLGLALNAAGRTEEGLQALIRAESAAPEDPRNPYARATILARFGRMNEARQAARRALEIQPGFTPAQEFLRSLQN